jgi:small subunit ribosomal protein S20
LANTRSAKKRIRQTARRRTRNRVVRTRARGAVKLAKTALESGEAQAGKAVRDAVSELDRAAAKGVIHKNNAARRKRRLAKRLAGAKKPG